MAKDISAPIDFEKALSDLQQIVRKLETGELPLEQSLLAFEQGVQLSRECASALKTAEQRVEQLVSAEPGKAPKFEPMSD